MSMLSSSAWVDELLQERAEVARRGAPAHAARQSPGPDLQVRLAAAMRTTPSQAARQGQDLNVFRDAHVIGEVKSNGGRYIANDIDGRAVAECPTAHEAMRAIEQAHTDAGWAQVISEQNLGGTRAQSQTSPTDSNHGRNTIVAAVEREQPQTNYVSSGASSEADRSWTEIIRGMNAKVGASA